MEVAQESNARDRPGRGTLVITVIIIIVAIIIIITIIIIIIVILIGTIIVTIIVTISIIAPTVTRFLRPQTMGQLDFQSLAEQKSYKPAGRLLIGRLW